jgi:protein-tyrosine-phosphatase
MGARSVLFVCTANRIRSPMAAALWRAYVTDHYPEESWEIGSAGVWTADGLPALPLTIAIMAERGLDLRAHRSQVIDRALMDRYALVVVMERGHKEALQMEFPKAAERTFLLSELAAPQLAPIAGVDDPVGGDAADYRRTATELAQLLEAGAGRIHQLANRQD